jgi:hypothetical protein
VMVVPSHADDGVAEAARLWHDVYVESCWRLYCRVMLAMALQLKVAQPPSSEHRGVVIV